MDNENNKDSSKDSKKVIAFIVSLVLAFSVVFGLVFNAVAYASDDLSLGSALEDIYNFWNDYSVINPDNWYTGMKDIINFGTTYSDEETLNDSASNFVNDSLSPAIVDAVSSAAPSTSFTMPETYHFIGKSSLGYTDGTFEEFEVELCWSGYNVYKDLSSSPSAPYQNYVTLRRYNVSTGVLLTRTMPIRNLSFSTTTINSTRYLRFSFSEFQSSWTNVNLYFAVTTLNDIRELNVSSIPSSSYWLSFVYKAYNVMPYYISMGNTSSQTNYLTMIDYYNQYGGGTLNAPIVMSPISSDTVINTNNYNDYSEYGFGVDVDGNLSFDPDVFALGFLADLEGLIDAKLAGLFDLRVLPGDTLVNPTYDTEINYNDIYNYSPPETVTTLSGGGGGYGDVIVTVYVTNNNYVDVEVNATLPPEWLEDYPELDTTPDIVLDDPDMFELVEGNGNGAEFPASLTSTVSGYFNLATDFLVSTGLYRLMLFFIVLGIFWKFTGG